MGIFDNLPTLAERSAERYATPKHEIVPKVIASEAKRQTKKKREEAFRLAVWSRDKGICRATGVPLSKSGTDPHRVGEVDHTLLRSMNPDRIYDVENGVLISKYLNRLRKVPCRNNPKYHRFDYDGPEDRGKPQTFRWRNDDGVITKERIG